MYTVQRLQYRYRYNRTKRALDNIHCTYRSVLYNAYITGTDTTELMGPTITLDYVHCTTITVQAQIQQN